MKFLILTPTSLITHENYKMSKVPQKYYENIISWNCMKYCSYTELKDCTTHWIENWGELTSLSWIINDHDNEKQWKYYIA